jgi:hypothetical protein
MGLTIVVLYGFWHERDSSQRRAHHAGHEHENDHAQAMRHRGSLRGRLVSERGSVLNANLLLVGTDVNGRVLVRELTGDRAGMFEASDLHEGRYMLHCSSTTCAPALTLPVTLTAGSDVDMGTVQLDRGHFWRGSVIDGDGNPIPDATVRLWEVATPNPLPWGDTPRPLAVASTDDNGRYHLQDVRPGHVILTAQSSKGFAIARHTVFANAKECGDHEFVVPNAQWARGRVLDDFDKPIAGAQIYVYANSNTPPAWATVLTESNSAGEFDLPMFRPGVLQVVADGFPMHRFPAPLDAGTFTVTLRRDASVIVYLVDVDGQPISSARILVYMRQADTPTLAIATTDASGIATCSAVSGTLECVAMRHSDLGIADWRGGWPGLEGPDDPAVHPGRNEFTFVHTGGVEVAGRVVDKEQNPIAGARCSHLTAQYGEAVVISDDVGAFRIRMPNPRSPRYVHTTAYGYVQEPRGVAWYTKLDADGDGLAHFDVTMVREARVVGRVVDSGGRPQARAFVRPTCEQDILQMLAVPAAAGIVTTHSGLYVVDGLPPGIEVSIVHASGARTAPFGVRDGVTLAPDLVLDAAATPGR